MLRPIQGEGDYCLSAGRNGNQELLSTSDALDARWKPLALSGNKLVLVPNFTDQFPEALVFEGPW
jgi:hypothetical protein